MLIKTYLRSTMLQDRLCNLAILSIENEVAKLIDYTDVVDDFASLKARKVEEGRKGKREGEGMEGRRGPRIQTPPWASQNLRPAPPGKVLEFNDACR